MAKIEEARERKISSESNTTPEKKVGTTTAPSSDENKNNSNSRHDLFTLIINSKLGIGDSEEFFYPLSSFLRVVQTQTILLL